MTKGSGRKPYPGLLPFSDEVYAEALREETVVGSYQYGSGVSVHPESTLHVWLGLGAEAPGYGIEFTDADVILSDNYFDLLPGESRTVWVEEIRSGGTMDAKTLAAQIYLRSNYDISTFV